MDNLISLKYVPMYNRIHLIDFLNNPEELGYTDMLRNVFMNAVEGVASPDGEQIHIGYFFTNVMVSSDKLFDGFTIAYFSVYDPVEYRFVDDEKTYLVRDSESYQFLQRVRYLGLEQRTDMDYRINGLLFYENPLELGKVFQPRVRDRLW